MDFSPFFNCGGGSLLHVSKMVLSPTERPLNYAHFLKTLVVVLARASGSFLLAGTITRRQNFANGSLCRYGIVLPKCLPELFPQCTAMSLRTFSEQTISI